jgi:ribosomal protein S18 acetylase RimI-like enzyme
MINLRPLEPGDIPNLPQIRPTYKATSILALEKSGTGLELGWQLVEHALPQPFDKGALYDFDEIAQGDILARLERPDDTYQRVAEYNDQLVGLLDMELQPWNDTALLWNLMIDLDFRGQGLGRRLWHRALEFAREAEVRAIMIETQNNNVPACKFYARMGCQLVGMNEVYYANDGSQTEVALFWAYLMPGYRPSMR